MFPTMPCFYILDEDGETPVRATTEECAMWLATGANAHRCIVEQTIIGQVQVSTVFLKLDHNMSMAPGKPVLWETMIFGEGYSTQERYTSLVDAKLGHKRSVWQVRSDLNVKAS